MSTVMQLGVCTRVCFTTFFRAAFASATIALSRGAQVKQVDIELTGPGRNCPFSFGGDPAHPSVSREDLSAADVAAPTSPLPPALGTPSAEQEGCRKEVRSTLQSLFALSATSGTVRTYEATLRAIAPKVTAKCS